MKKLLLPLLSLTLSLPLTAWSVGPDDFQTTKRDTDFSSLMSTLDLNGPGVTYEYKDTGTSIGIKPKRDGKGYGKWVPQNEATDVEAQVVSYHLGRFLGMSDIVLPSAYYTLTNPGLQQFSALITKGGPLDGNVHRTKNKARIQAAIRANPSSMLGVYTPKLKFESLEVDGIRQGNNIISSHQIAKSIRADQPMPSNNLMALNLIVKKKDREKIDPATVKELKDTELELARQFSKIMVLDMLCGQYDRWSGGNVEAGYDLQQKRVFFFARDNGGAGMSGKAEGVLTKYSTIVTRFDSEQIARVELLVKYLSNPSEAAQLKEALGLKANPTFLLGRARAVLAHVRAQATKHGDKAFFPAR